MTEQTNAEKRAAIAQAICNSEPFMWLMVGSNHQEAQLQALRDAWRAYVEADGGYGKWNERSQE